MTLEKFLNAIRGGVPPQSHSTYEATQDKVMMLTKHTDFYNQGEVFTSMRIKLYKDIDGVWTMLLVRQLVPERVQFEKNRIPIYAGTAIVHSYVDENNRHITVIKHIDLWLEKNIVVNGDTLEYLVFNTATLVTPSYLVSNREGLQPLYMRLFSPDIDYKNFPKWQRSTEGDFDNALISVSEETSDFCNAVGNYDRFFNIKNGKEVVSKDGTCKVIVFTEELRGKMGTALVYDTESNRFATVNLTQFEDKDKTVMFYNDKEFFVERGLRNVSAKSKPYSWVIKSDKGFEAG